jgi:hypothetical protein
MFLPRWLPFCCFLLSLAPASMLAEEEGVRFTISEVRVKEREGRVTLTAERTGDLSLGREVQCGVFARADSSQRVDYHTSYQGIALTADHGTDVPSFRATFSVRNGEGTACHQPQGRGALYGAVAEWRSLCREITPRDEWRSARPAPALDERSFSVYRT